MYINRVPFRFSFPVLFPCSVRFSLLPSPFPFSYDFRPGYPSHVPFSPGVQKSSWSHIVDLNIIYRSWCSGIHFSLHNMDFCKKSNLQRLETVVSLVVDQNGSSITDTRNGTGSGHIFLIWTGICCELV